MRLTDSQMRCSRHIWLVLAVVVAACARASSGSTTGSGLPSGLITLSGTITGLVPDTSADLRLELLATDQKAGQGQVITRFKVTNGQWEQTGLGLEPGRYGLVPEAAGYVSRFGTTTFDVVSGGGSWFYRHVDFELMRPQDALARVGVPLCSTPPPQGGEYVVPEGPPTATPTFALNTTAVTASASAWPQGTCYAGQYNSMGDLSAGISGHVSGLPSGQVTSIFVYALPPVPDENYAISTGPPLDGSWHYPEVLSQMATVPTIDPDATLTLTLTVNNGPWGVIDNGLIGQKYLVMAQAPGRAANPPAYQAVVFGGKILSPVTGVDFDFVTR